MLQFQLQLVVSAQPVLLFAQLHQTFLNVVQLGFCQPFPLLNPLKLRSIQHLRIPCRLGWGSKGILLCFGSLLVSIFAKNIHCFQIFLCKGTKIFFHFSIFNSQL